MLIAAALLASACGTASTPTTSSASSAQPIALSSTTPSPSPTPQPTINPAAPCTDCWPLLGAPLKGGDPTRRPLLVKIDNAPTGRPHYGLTQADLVFEILVEGFVTRLAAVFQSQDPAVMGNIRSARPVDRSLTPMIRGMLVYSGTSAYEAPLIIADALRGKYIELSADTTPGYYRVNFRLAPYNMFAGAAEMRRQAAPVGGGKPVDVPRWGFLAREDHAPAIAGMAGAPSASEIVIPYREDTSLVTYRYDDATRTYERWQNSAGVAKRDVDPANNSAPIAAKNVVIIYTEIWEVPQIVDAAGAHAHDMRVTGTGAATVLRDGLRQEGTWSRPSENDAFAFKTNTGQTILLSPGQTWVHIIPTDWQVTSQ